MKVGYYTDDLGNIPFKDWLDSIKDKPTKSRLFRELTKLELGLLGDPKSLGKGLYEKKIKLSTSYRFYYGYHDKDLIIMLAGSDKDGQKKEIKKAHGYWEDYKTQQENKKGISRNEQSK